MKWWKSCSSPASRCAISSAFTRWKVTRWCGWCIGRDSFAATELAHQSAPSKACLGPIHCVILRFYVPLRSVAVGWFASQQIANEEIVLSSFSVCPTAAVTCSGNDQQVEVFARFDECVRQAKCILGGYVHVELAHDQEQFSSQGGGVFDVRRCGVVRADGVTHPLFVPVGFIHPIVVAATGGDGHFVKLGMEQNGAGGILTAGGSAVDADA